MYISSDDNRAPFERSILLEFKVNNYSLLNDKDAPLVEYEMPAPYGDL